MISGPAEYRISTEVGGLYLTARGDSVALKQRGDLITLTLREAVELRDDLTAALAERHAAVAQSEFPAAPAATTKDPT